MGKILITFCILSCTSSFLLAQNKNDTLQNWISKFSKIVNPVISEDGNWVAVRKRYDKNQDTLIVLNTQKSIASFRTLVLGGRVTFLKGDGLLVSGNDKAAFWNLKTNKRDFYENVKVGYSLSNIGRYAILDRQDNLRIYNIDGTALQTIEGIQGFPTCSASKMFVCTKNGNNYEVMDMLKTNIYTTSNIIKKIELAESGNHLIISENEKGKDRLKITFVDLSSGKLRSIPSVDYGPNDYYTISNIKQGEAFLISLFHVNKLQSKTVEIWYGNENNLEAKKKGSIKNRYWICNTHTGHVQELPTDRFDSMVPLNSERFFLAYEPRKGFNYLTYHPQITDAFVYDVKQNTYQPVGSLKGILYGTAEIICSPDGRFIMLSTEAKRWTIVKLESLEKTIINNDKLQNPIFTKDSQSILFESPNDLWWYDIDSNKLAPLNLATGKQVDIINATRNKLVSGFQCSVNYIDHQKPILIKTTTISSNTTSYFSWTQKKIHQVIAPTLNKVQNILYDDQIKKFCMIEENFDMPPKLSFKNDKQKKQLLLEDKTNARENRDLKQNIVHYVTADNIALKGVLYYPINYNPNKKYPMVVHIYEIQSSDSNLYLTPGFLNPEGLDIRTLIQRGYFVFLPDITKGKLGAGLSALECVNKAMDAVGNVSGIDMQRVGLIGHSFGGYEVDFISTHSNRFTTFISGSGDSDIINSYFSYNYHYPGAHYWQFETGQYKMPEFSNNKELYIENNPIHSVDKVTAPILLWTGLKDENIPWSRTMEFYIGLKRNSTPVIALFYPDGGHVFRSGSDEMKDVNKKILEWWDYFLKNKKNTPWIDQLYKKNVSQF